VSREGGGDESRRDVEDRTELVSQIFGMEKEDRERERERERKGG